MSLYDENLVDNPFFKEVLNQEDFLNEIIANKWYAFKWTEFLILQFAFEIVPRLLPESPVLIKYFCATHLFKCVSYDRT